jgi:hypothetical protein
MDNKMPDEVIDQGPEVVEPEATVAPQETSYADTFLKDIPDNDRPIVEKYVKDWDAGVTKRFQEVHSEYADYKPFKEQGYTQEDLGGALALAQALEENPQGTLQLIAEHYGITLGEAAQAVADATNEQGQQQPVGAPPSTGNDAFFNDPRFQQVQQIAETAAQILLSQKEQEEQAATDAKLDQTIKELHDKHGDFDEKWVLPMAYQMGDFEAAVTAYKEMVNNILTQNNRPAPVVLGSGGGLPATGIDPTKLDSKGTKELVAGILEKANAERG